MNSACPQERVDLCTVLQPIIAARAQSPFSRPSSSPSPSRFQCWKAALPESSPFLDASVESEYLRNACFPGPLACVCVCVCFQRKRERLGRRNKISSVASTGFTRQIRRGRIYLSRAAHVPSHSTFAPLAHWHPRYTTATLATGRNGSWDGTRRCGSATPHGAPERTKSEHQLTNYVLRVKQKAMSSMIVRAR